MEMYNSDVQKAINDLGGKQKEIYNFIKGFIDDNGYPPTIRDICNSVGLNSTSTVHGHLARLEKKGLIKRDPTKTRAIILASSENVARQNAMSVPLVGKVTAGQPILAYENIEEYLPLPASLVRDENSFVLQVEGESMINAGIYNGDFIIVRKQNYADDGDIVVALIDDEATVKRIFYEKKHVRLQPENPTMEPMIFDRVDVLGKVTGLYRRVR